MRVITCAPCNCGKNNYTVEELGLLDQATEHARAGLEEAQVSGNSLSICEAARLAACPIALAIGDLDVAERALGILNDQATRHDATHFKMVGNCLRAELLEPYYESGKRRKTPRKAPVFSFSPVRI